MMITQKDSIRVSCIPGLEIIHRGESYDGAMVLKWSGGARRPKLYKSDDIVFVAIGVSDRGSLRNHHRLKLGN